MLWCRRVDSHGERRSLARHELDRGRARCGTCDAIEGARGISRHYNKETHWKSCPSRRRPRVRPSGSPGTSGSTPSPGGKGHRAPLHDEGVANGDRAETEWGAHVTDAEYREEQ